MADNIDGFEIQDHDEYEKSEGFKSGNANMNAVKAGMTRELRNRALEHGRRPDEEKQQIRNRSEYVMPETTAEEDEAYTPNLAQVDNKIQKSNREIAKEVFGSEVYDAADEARKGAEQDRRVNIHHSRGNAQLSKGEPVLEIDIAGSGFAQTRKEYHGNINWQSYGRDEGQKDPEFAAFLDQEYGRTIDGKKHVRQKTTSVTLENGTQMQKNRLNIAGPNALNTSGDEYNINNTREYATSKVVDFLDPILKDYARQKKADPNAELKDIHVNITGHSRGGVAAGETVRLAYDWLKGQEQYRDVAEHVKFDLIQRDPVPGYGDYTEHGNLDLSDIPGLESTVVYSMSQQHYDKVFKPQKVEGADRIIFGVMSHNVDLDGVDLSQAGFEEDGMAHKRGFYDAATGEFYRGSGMSELPKGLYFTDENLNLLRVDSFSQIDKLADAAFEGNDGLQKRRLNVLKSAAKDWFVRNDLTHSYGSEAARKQSLEQMERTKKTLMESKDPRLQQIRDSISILNEVTKGGDKETIQEALRDVRDSCREFMKGVDLPEGKDEPEPLLNTVGDLLTGVQKEHNFLERGLDRRMDLPQGREKAGEAERQLERDADRLDRNVKIDGTVRTAAWKSSKCLKRLAAKPKNDKNSKTYDRLEAALQKVSKLDHNSTVNEALEAIHELKEASNAYKKSHRGVFSGHSDFGAERRDVAKESADFAKAAEAELKKLTKEIPNKDARIFDLLAEKADVVTGLQGRVDANAAKKEQQKQVFEGAREAIGQDVPKADPSKVKETDVNALRSKLKLDQPEKADYGKKASKEAPVRTVRKEPIKGNVL